MGAASPEDTLITEKDTEKALETEREVTLAIALDHLP